MLVKVLNFGTNWWARFGRDAEDPYRFSRHAAYYNSTGVRCGSKIRRHWITSGLLRFNGVGDFNPNLPKRAIGRTFVCSDLPKPSAETGCCFKAKPPSRLSLTGTWLSFRVTDMARSTSVRAPGSPCSARSSPSANCARNRRQCC